MNLAKNQAITGLARLFIFAMATTFNRIRYNWLYHLGLFFSALALSSVFVYIASDFVTIAIKGVSAELSVRMGQGFSIFIFFLAALFGGAWQRAPLLVHQLAEALGEDRFVMTISYRAARILRLIVPANLAVWGCAQLFSGFSVEINFGLILATVAVQGMVAKWLGPLRVKSTGRKFTPHQFIKWHEIAAMAQWRFFLLQRNPLSQICFVFGFLFILATGYFAYIGHYNRAILMIPSALCGLWCTFGMIYQTSQEIRDKWIEKGCAITHQQYVAGLMVNCFSLGFFMGLLLFLSSGDGVIAMVGVVPLLMYPCIIFAFDPKSMLIPMVGGSLILWILGTAVFAFPILGILGTLAAMASCLHYQNNKFYRSEL